MDTRIKALIGAHAFAFVVAAIAASGHAVPDPAPIVFAGLISANAALLGLWAAVGSARWQIRLFAVSAALFVFWVVFLFEQQRITEQDVVGLGLFFSLPCAVIFVVLSLLRRRRRHLALRHAGDAPAREGFQFSLRGLLLAITLVAIALSVGRATRFMGAAGDWLRVCAILLVVAPSFVLVELATFWAALGLARPLPRLLVVIPLAFILGFASAFGFAPYVDSQQFVIWSGLSGTTAVVIAVSLLVVRSAGWRLCSAADERRPDSTDIANVEDASPF